MPTARASRSVPVPGLTPLFDSGALRDADRRCSEDLGMPTILLMERAGLATAEVIRERFPAHRRAWVVVGPGNNGGDGMVIARHLAESGVTVRVLAPGGREPAGADASAMVSIATSLGIAIEPLDHVDPPAGTLVVDALLGTGASGAPRGDVGAAIDWLATLEAPVVAVDLPSGVDADSGTIARDAAGCALTVTYHGDLVGLRVEPGRSRAGEVIVADIGIPSAVLSTPAAWWAGPQVCRSLPARSRVADKYEAGAVLVVAGAPGLTGAALLSARAALRAGAGLCVLGVPAGIHHLVAPQCLEIMCVPLDDHEGLLTKASTGAVVEQARRVGAVAVGPGVGRSPATTEAIGAMMERLAQTMVLDADGLWHLAAAPDMLAARRAPTVITPHAGEAAHLLGVDRGEVESHRLRCARALVERFGVVVVLKGPGTLVIDTDGTVVVDGCGTEALASAGSGDVLTGIVAAHLASGRTPLAAAVAAVALHGCAGVLAGRGPATIASDLIEALPAARTA